MENTGQATVDYHKARIFFQAPKICLLTNVLSLNPTFCNVLLNLHLHRPMPDSANRSVNCKYKTAIEDIFNSFVKASRVGRATNEMHAVGFAGLVSETGHDSSRLKQIRELLLWVVKSPAFSNRKYCFFFSMKICCWSEKTTSVHQPSPIWKGSSHSSLCNYT